MPWKEMKGEAEAQAGYQFAYWALPGAGRAGGLAERTGGKVPASRNRASRSASVAMDFSPWLQRPEHRAVFTLLEGARCRDVCARVCTCACARLPTSTGAGGHSQGSLVPGVSDAVSSWRFLLARCPRPPSTPPLRAEMPVKG